MRSWLARTPTTVGEAATGWPSVCSLEDHEISEHAPFSPVGEQEILRDIEHGYVDSDPGTGWNVTGHIPRGKRVIVADHGRLLTSEGW